METDAEVWITGVVETDAEVWISRVVTTGGRVHWLLSLPLPCSESLLITELLALLFPSVFAHPGFEEITNGCITLTYLPFYFNFVCIHI